MNQMTFSFLGQDKITEGEQAVYWYLFSINTTINDTSFLINEFLHSENFKNEALPFIVKKDTNSRFLFLNRAFNEDVLSVKDFKLLRNDQLYEYFLKYSNESDWGDDRKDFKILLEKFNELFSKEAAEKVFLINMDWFDKSNPTLNSDSEFYLYYFITIWVDKSKQQLNVCEWIYD